MTIDPQRPLHRSLIAMVVMIPLFSLLYIPTLFLIESATEATDGWADIAYVVVAMAVYVGAVVVVIPLTALTFARWIDAKTRQWPLAQSAGVFAATAGLVGLLPAIPMMVEGAYGTLPVLMFVLAPAVAGGLTRVVLEPVMRSPVLRMGAIALTIGVGVSLVVLAVFNVVTNVA